jgi:hypothetical protein
MNGDNWNREGGPWYLLNGHNSEALVGILRRMGAARRRELDEHPVEGSKYDKPRLDLALSSAAASGNAASQLTAMDAIRNAMTQKTTWAQCWSTLRQQLPNKRMALYRGMHQGELRVLLAHVEDAPMKSQEALNAELSKVLAETEVVTGRQARAVGGEAGMGFAGYRSEEGWAFLNGPGGSAGHSWNEPGFDGVAFKVTGDFEIHILDNKSFARPGNVSTATALTTNLLKNLNDLITTVSQPRFNDVPRIQQVRSSLAAARGAVAGGQALPSNVRLVVTNFGGRSTGVTARLAARGVTFRDLMAPPSVPAGPKSVVPEGPQAKGPSAAGQKPPAPARPRTGVGAGLTAFGLNFLAGILIGKLMDDWFKEDWARAIQHVEKMLPGDVERARTIYPPDTPLFANVKVVTRQVHMGDGWTPSRTQISIRSYGINDHPVESSSTKIDHSSWPPGNMTETWLVSFAMPIDATPQQDAQ